MRTIASALRLAPLALLAGVAAGQGGDSCSTPTAISGVGSWAFDTSTASASGFSPCGANLNQDRFWLWTATAPGDFLIDTCGSTYDTRLAWYSGTGCAAGCGFENDDTCGLQSTVTVQGLNVGDQVLLQVGGYAAGSFGPGTLNVSVDPCSALSDDGLEDNDTCGTAVPLAAGTYPGLYTAKQLVDEDFYRVTIPAGDALTVELLFIDANGDIDLKVYDVGCGTELATSTSATNNETAVVGNATGAPLDVIVEVYLWNQAPHVCNTYDMTLTTAPDPCLQPDDGFEENDSCAGAAQVSDGVYSNLFLTKPDNDYYEVVVANGSTLLVDIYFIHAQGDIDLFLYDSLGTCQAAGAPGHNCANSIACGFSVTDNESISWTNTTGADATYLIEVTLWPATLANCNTYELTVFGALDLEIGTNYCSPGVVNSTGSPGVMSATGSAVAADNDVTLTGSGLPNGQFAYFIASQAQGFIPGPGGSQGNLCLANPIARFNSLVGAINGGAFSAQVNLTSFPAPPTFNHQVVAGETWHFQCWHRDVVAGVGNTSNFTDGLRVLFQ
jgi:hypothetical protein